MVFNVVAVLYVSYVLEGLRSSRKATKKILTQSLIAYIWPYIVHGKLYFLLLLLITNY